MSCTSCLKLLLKVTNYLLLFVGLATVGYGIYMFKTWHDTNHGFAIIPWFIIVATVVGLLVVLTATVGICGADCAHQNCCMNFYIFLMCLLLLGQIAIVVVLFVKDVQEYLPKDSSGDLKDLEDLVKRNLKVVQYGGIVILVIEVIGILTACILSVIDHKRKQDEDDDLKDPVLQQSAGYPSAIPPRKNANDPWSRHISQKYNLDTSKFTYDPEHQHSMQAASADARGENKKGCVIM